MEIAVCVIAILAPRRRKFLSILKTRKLAVI